MFYGKNIHTKISLRGWQKCDEEQINKFFWLSNDWKMPELKAKDEIEGW